jgi:hypothetical protein
MLNGLWYVQQDGPGVNGAAAAFDSPRGAWMPHEPRHDAAAETERVMPCGPRLPAAADRLEGEKSVLPFWFPPRKPLPDMDVRIPFVRMGKEGGLEGT